MSHINTPQTKQSNNKNMVFFSLITWATHLLSMRNILHYSSKLSGHGVTYFVDMQKNDVIYLTYDLATDIDPSLVDDLAKVINEEFVKVTFFVSVDPLQPSPHQALLEDEQKEKEAEEREDKMQIWETTINGLISKGHDIGNGYNRGLSAVELSDADLEDYLLSSEQLLKRLDPEYLYKSPKFFRNCQGGGSRAMNQIMESNDYEQFKGDVFNVKGDFTEPPTETAKSLVDILHKGSIVVLPFNEDSKIDNVIEVTKLLIQGAKERGFIFKTLDSAFRQESYLKKLDL